MMKPGYSESRDCLQRPILQRMGLLVSGALFFLWGVVFSAEPGENAEEASDSAQAAQAVESLRQTSALDPDLIEAMKGPERLEPPDLPNPLRLDPMFTEFPELFTDPKMKSLSQEEYKAENLLRYEALYDRGVAARKRKDYEGATDLFSKLIYEQPPDMFRRKAFLQLALVAENQGYQDRALQIYSQYLYLFPDDHNRALVNLRMGHLLRNLGAMDQAIEHFHIVISITTRMKGVQDNYQPVVQRMALKAKIEIAKTYYEDLEFEKAGRLYKRLLSQQHGESELVAVDRPLVHFAAIDSYFRGENWEKVIEEGLDFLGLHRNHFKAPEIRFRMAKAYLSENKGREAEAAYQFKAIMESTTGFQLEDPMMWQQLKWQIGKEMGRTFTERNQPDLALEVYQGLIDSLPDLGLVDQVDLLYRTATLEESLNAKQKALELYQKIIELTESVGDGDTDSREAKIRQMALWKANLLKWLLQIGEALPAEEETPSG